MAADLMVDANGAAITVGATVKLVGVVTALDPFSNNFHDVTITLSHPVAGIPDVIVGASGTSNRPSAGAVKTLNVHPSMLVVGA